MLKLENLPKEIQKVEAGSLWIFGSEKEYREYKNSSFDVNPAISGVRLTVTYIGGRVEKYDLLYADLEEFLGDVILGGDGKDIANVIQDYISDVLVEENYHQFDLYPIDGILATEEEFQSGNFVPNLLDHPKTFIGVVKHLWGIIPDEYKSHLD